MEEKLCTSQQAYEIPILKVLVENGGKLSQNEVLQRLEEKFTFLPGDKSIMSTGCIKWHNNSCWARFKMVKKGEIDNSVRGIWIITEKGRERYEVEKDSYDQSKFKPSNIRESSRKRKQKIKQNLAHPAEVTTNYLQEWGIKIGLNLFDLGLDGVKDAYTEYYYKNSQISDSEYLEIIHSIFRDIKAFIEGNSSINPKNEQLCFWVHQCYTFNHYWEGMKLFNMIDEDSVSPDLYRITKKIADACRDK